MERVRQRHPGGFDRPLARPDRGWSETKSLPSYVDIPATFLDAAGTDPVSVETGCPDVTGSQVMDGRSFLAVLTGNRATFRDVVFGQHTTVGNNGYRAPYPMRAAGDARFQYIRNLAPDNDDAINGIHRGSIGLKPNVGGNAM
jgi:arylsulfatase A-like enzyme